MKKKQKKILKEMIYGVLLLSLVIVSFGHLESWLKEKDDETKEKPFLTVYVEGLPVEEESIVSFSQVGASKNITVKNTESHKVHDELLTWTFATDGIIDLVDVNGDDKFVSVELTSLAKTYNDFFLQISNHDGSFIFLLIIRTTLLLVVDFEIPDITIFQ